MKIRHLASALLGSCTLLTSALFSGEPSFSGEATPSQKGNKAVFDGASSVLDAGGDYYVVLNVSRLTGACKRLPALLQKIVQAMGGSRQDELLASEICRILVDVFNPSVLKAVSVSSAEMEEGVYRAQSYCYLGADGMAAPSVFDLTGKQNHPLDWRELPADTRFAVQSDFYPGVLYQRTIAAMKTSSDPKIVKLAAMAAELKQNGVDLEKILNSIDGFSLVVTGTSLQNLEVVFTLSDRSGEVTRQLQTILPPAAGSEFSALPLPIPGWSPVVRYHGRKITFASHREMLTRPVPAKLGDVARLRKFAAYLPTRGTGYLYIDLNAETAENLKAAISGLHEGFGPLLADLVSPFSMLMVSSVTREGSLDTIASDFSCNLLLAAFPSAVTQLPVAAAILLPALQKARASAHRTNCASNLKMAGLSLSIYANDHNGKLPDTLDELAQETDLSRRCLLCPATEVGYCYLGRGVNLNRIKNPSAYPLLCDPPASHQAGVNILFADGHVEFFPLTGCTEVSQIIGELNKINHYSPAELDAMLKALSGR